MPATIGQKERIIERRRWVMNERRAGCSLDEIHQAWQAKNAETPEFQVGRSTIANDIKECLRRSVEETNLATKEWRRLHIERLEWVISRRGFQKKLEESDMFAVDRFDKLMDKLIKLTGAYMPAKIANTDPTGEKEANFLSDDERAARIEEILAQARERREAAQAEAEFDEDEE